MKKIKFKNLAIVIAFMFGSLSPASQVMAQPESTRAGYQAGSEGIATDRIIVKYKSGTNAPVSPSNGSQMNRLSNKAGVSLLYVRTMAEGDTHVLQLPERLSQDQVQAISNQLMTLPEVEYAEPDRIVRHTLVPDDTEYVNQWHYFDTWGINAPAAWDITTGVSSIVVAVIDTGITNHADLSGRTVAGYDFIGNVLTANDGDGREADPSDPGDWITAAENSAPGGFFEGCGASYSSWHGTHVAGTIGAASNNTAGVAGINWNSMILPVRVLGKCGGYTSDVVDGMRWAAGLSVSGVPANANPAKVLNLSLGGSGACSVTEQSAINEITTAGAVVVVAAGNEYGDASNFSPGNCNGVITVAATDRNGQKASYSNSGSVVEISAPGGDGADGVLSTLNTGTTDPVLSPAGDTYVEYIGTSMATPHVSGVLSLMFSVNPDMSPAQALQLLQQTAKAFPGGGTCTTSNCGSGIVNAAAAVAEAKAPDLIITGYELVDPVTGLPLASAPTPNETFGIKAFVKNQGGDATAGVFYRSVFVDRNPMNPALFEITSPAGCLYNLSTLENDLGDYYIDNYFGGLPAGVTDTDTIVEVTGGLPVGNYQIWLYADPTCIVDNESIENNNSYGPININTSGYNSGPANIDISIGGTLMGNYDILDEDYLLQSYPGFFGGPVLVDSTNNVPTVSSIRLLYLNRYGHNTLSELMGVPTSQLLDNYWMPAYIDNDLMDSQVRFTNTSTTLSTTVQVFIGGVLRGTYDLAPSSAVRARYTGLSGGPVQIVGTPGVPILAGMRIIYGGPGGNSFDEIMAYPNTQLDDEYWFPFYNHNNVNLDTELRIGNTSSSLPTTVTVYLGSTIMGTYTLQPNTYQLISYPGINGGPVRVVGTTGVPIVASLRLLYLNKYGYDTMSELMGVSTANLLDNYSMPVYIDDNNLMDSQVRFTNTSTTQSTTIDVYLGANLVGTYVLGPSSANRIRFTGVSGGPVRIVGTPGVPILAGMRIIYGGPGGVSFDEIMAYPTTQLNPEYWFPFYNHNNVNLDTEVRIGVP